MSTERSGIDPHTDIKPDTGIDTERGLIGPFDGDIGDGGSDEIDPNNPGPREGAREIIEKGYGL